MRALATLILGIGMLWLGREYLTGQLNQVRSEISKPADVPEMKPAYDAEKLKDFDSTRFKPVGIGRSHYEDQAAPGSEPTTDLSSYDN